MKEWKMLTLVGEDRPGIVAKVTDKLFEVGANLGEASMMRLGANFTIMMMVDYAGKSDQLERLLEPVAEELGLRVHADEVSAHLHRHVEPDVAITVYGADQAGIVARVAGALAEAGLNILELDSDVAGSEAEPLYIMSIEGVAAEGIEALEKAMEELEGLEVDVSVRPIETVRG